MIKNTINDRIVIENRAVSKDRGRPFTFIFSQYRNYAKRKSTTIAYSKNVRGLGKSMVVFRLIEQLRYSDEGLTKRESVSKNRST